MLFIRTWKVIWRKAFGLLYLNGLLTLGLKSQEAGSAKTIVTTLWSCSLTRSYSNGLARKMKSSWRRNCLQSPFLALDFTLALIQQGTFGSPAGATSPCTPHLPRTPWGHFTALLPGSARSQGICGLLSSHPPLEGLVSSPHWLHAPAAAHRAMHWWSLHFQSPSGCGGQCVR